MNRKRCANGLTAICVRGLRDGSSNRDEGVAGIFPPQRLTAVQHQVRETLHRSPRLFQLERSRWWLDGVRRTIEGLQTYTLAGVHKWLKRLGLCYKRGRHYLHSPDPYYDLKMAYVHAALAQAGSDPERTVFLYMDEFTYYRRPSLAATYAPCASKQPLALCGYRSTRSQRIATCLNPLTGATFSWQRNRFDVPTLIRFFRAVEQAHPAAQRIYVALDNWPNHFHPQLLLALQNTPIVLLRLPTYAPWTNPVEKFWRRLNQELLHLHDLADDWRGLQAAVQLWLDRWLSPSTDLLRYVGLSPY